MRSKIPKVITLKKKIDGKRLPVLNNIFFFSFKGLLLQNSNINETVD